MTTAQVQAAIYCRISEDRTGEELGVTRQREDCEQLLVQAGWGAYRVYIDDDISAYSGKPRPQYLRMLDDVEAGRVGAIVAWHPDRLLRSPRELEDFIDLVEKTGARVRTVRAGEYDLATPSGRMTARIVGAVARGESEHKADRASRKMLQLAEAGRYTGGQRIYGYTTEFVPIPAEAEVIVEVARRVLAGEKLDPLARDLNERGIPTARGNPWAGDRLKRLIINPRLAGCAVYKGDVIGHDIHEAIIDRTTHEQVVRKLTANHGRKRRRSTRLLAGFIRCGRCGERMHGGAGNSGKPNYRCPKQPRYVDACGRLTVVGPEVDDEVRDLTLQRLSGEGLTRALQAAVGDDQQQQHIVAQLAVDEAALAELTNDFYVERMISREEFMIARSALTERVAAGRRSIRTSDASGVLVGLPTTLTELQAMWDTKGIAWRRAMIGAVVESVSIAPATSRGAPWTAERVEVVWSM